ncbi:MAG: S1 RNA-binding domain-containing protein [Anaerolineae bacterium]|nr:S1 RNA-binding domain-containing protein [Anaerolineae bacterium]
MTTDNAENTTPAALDTVSTDAEIETPVQSVAESAESVTAELNQPAAAQVPAETEAVIAEVSTETAAEEVAAETAAPAASALADLKPKQELRGTVKNIELFGAFVDVGVGVDGLLHISQISTEAVKNVGDVLKTGDEITVWVRKVDTAQGRLDLTMIKPLGLAWNEIRDGMVVTGKVVKIERFGVFVEIGAERPGMIHVSELAGDYVEKPEDVVKVGDEVTAKVIKVNRKRKQIDLSRKAMAEPTVTAEADDEEDDAPAMTAMELALRNAMRGTEMGDSFAASKKGRENKKQALNDKRRKEQEELLNRTLQNRVK